MSRPPAQIGVLGPLLPDLTSMILGTGYSRFESATGVRGLAKVHGCRLDLLVVDACQPGTGQFRAFVDTAKREFETIYLWEVWNATLGLILQRYGFRACREADLETGEMLDGYCYDAGRALIGIAAGAISP